MTSYIDIVEIQRFFKDCLAEQGHPLCIELMPATRTSKFMSYRCPNKARKNQDTRYKAYFDGQPYLFFECHYCGTGLLKFPYKKEFSREERRDYAQKMKIQMLKRIASERKAKEDHNHSLEAMRAEWRAAKPCINHPYLQAKLVTVTEIDGLRINARGNLLCPISSLTDELVSFQRVYWNRAKNRFEKRFFTGLPSVGFHVIGELQSRDRLLFAEGIATCLTIKAAVEALDLPIICVFGKRFDSIAKIIRHNYPAAKLIFCCDASTNPNERITSADNARRAIALVGTNSSLVVPDFTELKITPRELAEKKITDFNDFCSKLQRDGFKREAALARVRHQLISKPIRKFNYDR